MVLSRALTVLLCGLRIFFKIIVSHFVDISKSHYPLSTLIISLVVTKHTLIIIYGCQKLSAYSYISSLSCCPSQIKPKDRYFNHTMTAKPIFLATVSPIVFSSLCSRLHDFFKVRVFWRRVHTGGFYATGTTVPAKNNVRKGRTFWLNSSWSRYRFIVASKAQWASRVMVARSYSHLACSLHGG